MNDLRGPGSTEHDRLRSLVLARAAGLLDEGEGVRVDEHLATCEHCRALAAELAEHPAGAGDGQHLPAELVAAWPRTSETLQGIEREMVRRHLARCESCRDDLQVLGFSPDLPWVAALEWERPADVGQSTITPATIRPLPRAVRDVRVWVLGGWAGLATAAALVLALNPALVRGPVPVAPPIVEPVEPAPPPATSARAEVLELPVPIVPPTTLRGDGSASARASGHADASGRLVVVVLPAQPAGPGEVASVRLEVARADGKVMLQREESPSALSRRRTLVLDAGSERWTPGRYMLRLVLTPGPAALVPEPETREFEFEVVASR